YVVIAAKRDDAGLYVSTLDGHENKRLVYANVNSACTATGYLLFIRDLSLVAQQFDANKLELTGEPIPLVEQVTVGPFVQASFSVSDNGMLAYLGGGLTNSELMWVDRTGKQLGSIGPPAVYSNVFLSPDGLRVAAAIRDVQSTTRDIWIMDSVRST